MKLNTLYFSLTLIFLGGCGMIDMPSKMDQSNANMGAMQAKMDETNNQMKEMKREQKLAIALQNLLAKENTRYLAPVPTSMMGWGKAFSEAMTEDEFVKQVDLFMTEINEIGPDESLKDSDGKWPQDLVVTTDHDKLVKLYAVMIISGLADQSMIERVVKTEIENRGVYDRAAFNILAARAMFIHDVLLNEQSLAKPVDNPQKVSDAVDRAQHLDYIVHLPYGPKMSLKVYGMLNPDDNLEFVLDEKYSSEMWAKIGRAMDKDLPVTDREANRSIRKRIQDACGNCN